MSNNYPEDSVSSPEDSSGDPSDAKDRAQQVAGSAAEQGQHVAGVAQEHAKKITGEAKEQVQGLVDQATSQLDEQSRTQKAKLADTLRGFGEDLESMSSADSESTGPAQQLVQQAAHQANDLASKLESREPQELLDDVRRFAREKPGAFLLGALVAGVVVGRLTRGAKAAKDEGESSSATGPTSTWSASTDTTTEPGPIAVPGNVARGDTTTPAPVVDPRGPGAVGTGVGR